MKKPKLVIASDGRNTALALDGVVLGRGIERMEFVAGGDTLPAIRLLEINIAASNVMVGPDSLDEMLEAMVKE